jgi:hypothetical protein
MLHCFRLGRCVATPAALAILTDNGVGPLTLVMRHALGEWGSVAPDTRDANEPISRTRGQARARPADGRAREPENRAAL